MRSGKRRRMGSHAAEGGFTLVAVLAAMFLLALVSQRVMSVVSHQAQREREAELLRVGAEFVRAIRTYHERSPGVNKEWPPTLEALTDDKRMVSLQRYLRRVYLDPITHSSDWGIIPAPGGGIAGVYSKSEARPIRTMGPELVELGLGNAQRYSEWKFVYTPRMAVSASGARP